MTRNERKRKALAKRELLIRAVKDAFAAETARKDAKTAYSESTGRTVAQKGLVSRTGIIQRGHFVPRPEKPVEPLKGDFKERRAVGYFGGKRLTAR